MKRVLILGGTGFLGGFLAQALTDAPDFEPILPDRKLWDICDGSTLDAILTKARADVVVNMVAVSNTGAGADAVYAVNAQGALNLLEALIRMGFTGHHILFSSSNIYGAANGGCLSEVTWPLPMNHYSCAKLLAEHYCALYAQEINSTILRPFSIIGVGQKPSFLLPKLARHFSKRLPEIELGNLGVAKDFVDVRDLVAMIMCLLRADIPPNLVNLCNGEAVSLGRLLQLFREISGHSPKIIVNPNFVRTKDIHHQCGDPKRIHRLGYTRTYPINETVHWIYESARKQGHET